MRIQLRESLPILVGPSTIAKAGWGAFAPHHVEKGDFLIEYLGELISHEEADRRGQIYDRRMSSYLFHLNDKQVVDACPKGNRSRFLNHSDSANACTQIISVRGDHHIGMLAKKSMEGGEEIFFDYRYDQEERQRFGFNDGGSPTKTRKRRKRKRSPGPSSS